MSAWSTASWAEDNVPSALGGAGAAPTSNSAPRPRASVEPLQVWRSKQIRRVSGADPDAVLKQLSDGEGEPLVVTDAQASWFGNGARRWTLDQLARDYGEERVTINDRAPLMEWDDPSMRTQSVTLAEYAAYARGEPTSLSREPCENPWYMNSWVPFFTFPELLREWSYPYFVEDLLRHDNGEERSAESARKLIDYSKVFAGVPGCTTRLHSDNQQTHAWLAQVEGRKQFVLYAPSDAERLRLHAWEAASSEGEGQGLHRCFDPADLPDAAVYPEAHRAQAWTTILAPGETILVPRGWLHYARALDVNVTLMRNFANSANSQHFKRALERENAHELKNAPRILPAGACVACKRPAAKLKPCGSCHAVAYCGRECQKEHWATHKKFCSLLGQLGLRSAVAVSSAPSPSQHELFADAPLAQAKSFAKTVLRAGRGPLPHQESMVRVQYEGFLADGQRIDSSYTKGQAFDFHCSRSHVAKGWRDATMTMQLGEKAQIAVAPHAAYGNRGVENKVPPNSALVFQVEITEIY